YTLAADRQNASIERFINKHHEAVLRLIEFAARSIHAEGKWIGICGELGADTALTKRFLEMGIDELSVSPSKVLEVRNMVRHITVD
ncbi:MAG: putative PEP-binding protein, partial [Oscillospiraceae bacterium]